MAKICIICEGSYPYVVGGVSSWVHDLIQINKEHEFALLCIIPSEEFAVEKYELPENVREVKNIVLNPEHEVSTLKIMKNNFLRDKTLEERFKKAMNFKEVEPRESLEVMDELTGGKFGNPKEIIVSKLYWNSLVGHYNSSYDDTNYNVFYWTHRNIFLNLLSLMTEEIPEADVYHSVATGYAGFISAVAGQRNMGKVLLTEHGIYPREREEEILGSPWIEKNFKETWVDFFYYLSKLTYTYADEIVSLFEYNKNLQIEYGADRKKCTVITNGVDIERFQRIEKKSRKGFNVGSVFRVVPIKDVKMMLKAIKTAKRRMKDANFYLIGPTDENEEYYDECLKLMRDLNMESYVTFTGKSNVDEYYEFLDLLLLSSISEGQPLSILEGMASGIPVIATDVGNCREILIGKKDIGEAGIIVPPTSYTDLAEAMVKLYQNRDRLKEMGDNGIEIVKKYYRRDEFIRRYKELYERLGEGDGRNRI